MADRVCIVSGAASGIGRATLLLFAARGQTCLALDADAEALERLVADAGAGARVHAVQVDLLDDAPDLEALDSLAQAATALTLVNNVGGSRSLDAFEQTTWESFAEVLAFNLKPLHTLTRACLPHMRRHGGGRIVNVASVSARRALRQVGPDYAAAKAAVVALSRHLALALAEEDILVNTLCPGVIATDRIKRRWAGRSEETNARVLGDIPLHRLGRPEEVAEAIFFLASATYATGSILDLNGGMHLP
jgi:3-oxoacyl-[acyl-carrier protein] reductase